MNHPDPGRPDLTDDETLVHVLGAALDEGDPVPEAARRVAVAAFDLGHLEGELAAVTIDSAVDAPLAGARHDGAGDRYVEVEATRLRLELDLPAGEAVLVGQLHPPGPQRAVVEVASARGGVDRIDVPVDDLGRFQTPLGPGAVRLHLVTDDGPVVTPWIVR